MEMVPGGGGRGGRVSTIPGRVEYSYGPRPLNSTRRHGSNWGLVTCDMAF